jgi:putative transposase
MRRERSQQELALRRRGGRRPGAGRKPKGARAGVPHVTRPALSGREPLLITMKVRGHVWNLRARRAFDRVMRTFAAAQERFGTRLVQFSVQRDHIHLIAEAVDEVALSRSMQGLAVRIARAINRLMRRKGAVFADRYHERVLRTPRQTRWAIRYVPQRPRAQCPARTSRARSVLERLRLRRMGRTGRDRARSFAACRLTSHLAARDRLASRRPARSRSGARSARMMRPRDPRTAPLPARSRRDRAV